MIRVGVLRGGNDKKYKRSIDNGASVLNCLRSSEFSSKYKAVDIFIDEDGLWHLNGIPVSLKKIKENVDVVVNALLGKYSENGDIQKKLEENKIPYTCSSFVSSAISHDKYLTKIEFLKNNIKTPIFEYIPYEEIPEDLQLQFQKQKALLIIKKIAPPWIVKPVANGSSFDICVCNTFEDLVVGLSSVFKNKEGVLIEEFIKGKEGTVGVLNNFRNKDIYVLPSVQITLPKNCLFFNDNLKESNVKFTCPGNFTYQEKEQIEQSAKIIHKAIGLNFYSKIDFIVNPKRGVYFLEVNSQSEFLENSAMSLALDSVGSSLKDFIEHIIQEALKKQP